MEFQYSGVFDPSRYETQGLCDGISLRRHKEPVKEIAGIRRAQEDWTNSVGPLGSYQGGLNAECSFVQVTVPECLPERLEIISYANEFAFLYDDVMEKMDEDQGMGGNRQILDVFIEKSQKSGIESKDLGAKKIQSQILSEMMAIDKERALIAMNSWSANVELTAGRERSAPFTTLEEYLPYRTIDAGELLWFGTVIFGMALTILEEELDLCKQLARPAYVALSLTNNLFSWEKERDQAERDGIPHVINAIWVLIHERSITELEAKDLCRAKIKESVAEYTCVVEDSKKNPDLSLDVRKYLEALQYSISGNLVWSLSCPRYN